MHVVEIALSHLYQSSPTDILTCTVQYLMVRDAGYTHVSVGLIQLFLSINNGVKYTGAYSGLLAMEDM